MKIFKYRMDEMSNKWFKLELPIGAEFLSFQQQLILFNGAEVGARLFAWFKVDESAETCKREFILAGTGIDLEELRIEPTDKFLGTAQEGMFVWHLFERYEE